MILNNKLSGGASDVLYALFFRGALEDGDLPSKAGAEELRKSGLVKTQKIAASYRGGKNYNFLTPGGQEFAIAYLADSHFGKYPTSSLMGMDGHVANPGKLSPPLKAKVPTDVELFSILKQVEDEMVGKPLTAETAFTFMEEVKRRFADLIVIEAG